MRRSRSTRLGFILVLASTRLTPVFAQPAAAGSDQVSSQETRAAAADRSSASFLNPTAPSGEPASENKNVVSIDILRHPIRAKERRLLQSAIEHMSRRDHPAAIHELRETLARYPDSAAYVHSLLGVEYLRTDQFTAAADSFGQAAQLLPHDAANRYNLSVALVSAGEYERGEQEVRRALELDPGNVNSQELLRALLAHKGALPIETLPLPSAREP